VSGLIYHITARADWLAGQTAGAYRADSLESQGFIHCSKASQVLRVANAIYMGRHTLVIRAIDPTHVKAKVQWEPGTDKADELFPHIYGELNLDAVKDVIDIEPGDDGKFTLPGGVQ